jgi:hypothetical protein
MHPRLVEAALAGRETLGQMTDADAQAEGYPSLEIHKDLILRMHKGKDWNSGAKVWVHEFVRALG